MLQRTCRLGEAAGASGLTPFARTFRPLLRATLCAVGERGVAAKASWRFELRRAVERVHFGAGEEGPAFRRWVEELQGIVDGETRPVAGERWRLRSAVLAVREAVGATVVADEEEKRLRWEVWEEVDGLLAEAVQARDERDGGVDQACTAFGY
jgi:hypothetical protein